MKPIICWNLDQAWKVKRTFDALGQHVTIRTAYPFKDYPKRDKSKKCFICDIAEPVALPVPKKTILAFLRSVLKIIIGYQPSPPKKGNTNGKITSENSG